MEAQKGKKNVEEHLEKIAWLQEKRLRAAPHPSDFDKLCARPYGNLAELNSYRVIKDAIGEETLIQIAGQILDIVDTSVTIYEKNGDYALSLFASRWCDFLDQASRALCDTGDNRRALLCGKWHCHESCWNEASRVSIKKGEPVDVECRGGIRIYAIPIWSGGKIIGSISLGYGDPPVDERKLLEIADTYGVSVEELKEKAAAYDHRPPFLVNIAKSYLHFLAMLIGELVDQKLSQKRIEHLNVSLKAIRNVNQLIVHEKDPRRLIQKACDRLTETGGYYTAWICLMDEGGIVHLSAESGIGEDFEGIVETFENGRMPYCARVVLNQADVLVIENVSERCAECPLKGNYEGREAMSVRMEYEGTLYGVLTTSVPCGMGRYQEERSLIKEVANDIAYALHAIEAESKYRKAVKELELFRHLIDMSSEGVFVVNSETARLEDVNKKAWESLGYTREELLRLRVTDIQGALPDEVAWKKHIRALRKEGYRIFEGIHRRKDGTTFPVEVNAALVVRDDREYSVAFVRDISERKEAGRRLCRLEAAINQAGEAVIMTDSEANIEYVNPAFEDITGYKKEEVLGENPRILKSGKHDREYYENMYSTLAEGKVWRGHFINKKKDGTLYHEEAVITSVRDETGAITGYVGIKTDVTDKMKLEKQLQQAQKMEAIGRLAGGIAHDFNNLLTTIIGSSDLILLDLDEADSNRDDVLEIKKAAKRASMLTRQLLAFSRRQTMQPEVMDLNEVVLDMEKMLRRLIGEDIDLITNLDENLRRVKADRSQIEQVVMNLAVNARDAMPKGGKLTIETANVELDENYVQKHVGARVGSYVMIAMTDTGMGMDEKTKSRIFEPFFTTKDRGKGTGLGLAMVYGIVKQSHGSIWVYSEPGKGTTFKIYLPSTEEDKLRAPTRGDESEYLHGSETILLVEDDDMVRRLACRILLKAGYKVLTARYWKEALKVSDSHVTSIDLVITDVVMPEMGGKDLVKRLSRQRPEIRALYMSGYTDNAIVNHGVLEPGIIFLEKPFTQETLLRKVREALESGKVERIKEDSG